MAPNQVKDWVQRIVLHCFKILHGLTPDYLQQPLTGSSGHTRSSASSLKLLSRHKNPRMETTRTCHRQVLIIKYFITSLISYSRCDCYDMSNFNTRWGELYHVLSLNGDHSCIRDDTFPGIPGNPGFSSDFRHFPEWVFPIKNCFSSFFFNDHDSFYPA
jgi:hypothetical protein